MDVLGEREWGRASLVVRISLVCFFCVAAVLGRRRWLAFVCTLIFCVFVCVQQFYTSLLSGPLGFLMGRTRDDVHIAHHSYNDDIKTNTVVRGSFYSPDVDRYNISYAYAKNWVGFPSFESIDCQEALNYSTLNESYPTDVDRMIPADFLEDTKDCKTFINKSGYLRYPSVSSEERKFPIAFIILFHKDLDQVHFLLRAIYRPHNVYCLSVDTKASVEFLEATRSIARCLPNVFVSSKLENIVYAGFSRLMADLHCLKDLLSHSVPWKYVINSPGQAFPLKTNLEMVRLLKLYNGTNDVEAFTGNRLLKHRFETKWEYVTNRSSGHTFWKNTYVEHPPPPHGLEVVKCSAYVTLTRQFSQFIITEQIAHDLLEWTKPVYSPDEIYWCTLNFNKILPAPGGFKGVPKERPWLTSFSVWTGERSPRCATMFVRDVCIFSPAELSLLVKQRSLFANKFYITHHPVTLHCLDQLIYNITFSREVRDMEFYQSLDLTFRGGP